MKVQKYSLGLDPVFEPFKLEITFENVEEVKSLFIGLIHIEDCKELTDVIIEESRRQGFVL